MRLEAFPFNLILGDPLTTKFRVAIAGAGTISNEHLTFLRDSSSVELVGICDPSLAMAQFAALRFGVAQVFQDLSTMLVTTRPDVVHVLTPPATHFEVARACLEAKAHVLCEKPITLSRSDVEKLFEIAKTNNRTLIENQNYRFNKPVLWLNEVLAGGQLGTLTEVELRLSLQQAAQLKTRTQLPGGLPHDFLPHLAYLALHFGGVPESVQSHWRSLEKDGSASDTVDAWLTCGQKVTKIHLGLAEGPDTFAITLRGTKASVETDLFNPYFRVLRVREPAQLAPIINLFLNGWEQILASARNLFRKIKRENGYEGLERFLASFYASLESDLPAPVSETEILNTFDLVTSLIDEKNHV